MSTLSIHPIEFFKVHAHVEGTHLITEITALVKKTLAQTEAVAKGVAVVLAGTLVVLTISIIGESGAMTATFYEAIPKVVFTP